MTEHGLTQELEARRLAVQARIGELLDEARLAGMTGAELVDLLQSEERKLSRVLEPASITEGEQDE